MYLHNIVAIVEENTIPQNLIMNLDQTPLKYVPVSHHTMAKKGVKSQFLSQVVLVRVALQAYL